MKKLVATALVVLCTATYGWATPIYTYTGSISNTDGTLKAFSHWNDGDQKGGLSFDSKLAWTVTADPADPNANVTYLLWTYHYTFQVDEKAISHAIIEVSKDNPDTPVINEAFTSLNILSGGGTLGTWGSQGQSNVGIPSPLYGIKWAGGGLILDWTIVSDRAPMWGDFYAKDGNSEPIPYAYNLKFGSDAADAIGDGNAGGWVLVPDSKRIYTREVPTNPVPEPGTVVLLGGGLLGMALYGRRRLSR